MAIVPKQLSNTVEAADKAAEVVKPVPKKILKQSVFLVLQGPHPLSEPYTHQRFNPGAHTEVSEITPWLQFQIDAGLFEVIE